MRCEFLPVLHWYLKWKLGKSQPKTMIFKKFVWYSILKEKNKNFDNITTYPTFNEHVFWQNSIKFSLFYRFLLQKKQFILKLWFANGSVLHGQNSHLNQDCGSLIFEPGNLTKKLLKIPDVFWFFETFSPLISVALFTTGRSGHP